MKKLCLFTSAFNVKNSHTWLVRRLEVLQALLHKENYDLTVLIIDDASTDSTYELFSGSARELPFLAVKRNETNQCNATNIVAGYKWAIENSGEGDLIACIDSDGEHEPTAVWECLDLVRPNTDYDGVIGCINYPSHLFTDPADLDMMRAVGALQAKSMGIKDPFIPQSPGFHVVRPEYVKAALKMLPEYELLYKEHNHGTSLPRWGMHYVIDSLSVKSGARYRVRYLSCLGAPPNRTPDKRIAQAMAALSHIETLKAYPGQS